VGSPLSLYFDGAYIRGEVWSLEEPEGEKVSLPWRRRPRIFSWDGSAPLRPLHAQFGLLHLLSVNTFTTLLSHFYSRAHYTSFPLTEPIFPK
jgi:hypothetical protein